jgi:hypothetical protein
MKIIIKSMNSGGALNEQIIEGDFILEVSVNGFSILEDFNGGIIVRTKRTMNISPRAANSIVVEDEKR